MSKEQLRQLVNTSYDLLTKKVAYGGITTNNEAAFQLELGYILKTMGSLYEFLSNDLFRLEFETYLLLDQESIKSKSNKARVDIIIEYEHKGVKTTAAIELKYFKKENHREPNNRYDVFKDLSNLEQYKNSGIDQCYFILVTDHLHYVSQEKYSPDTSDFDFRNGSYYRAGNELVYRTDKPHGPPITLSNDYTFIWDSYDGFHFLKVEL